MKPIPTRSLADLLERIGVAVPAGLEDLPITGVTKDSRAVRPGEIFVAIAGTHQDGHDYIPQAIERGAGAILAERVVEGADRVPVFRVADGRLALAELAAAWAGDPAAALDLVGITGTLGKTSVLATVQEVLAGSSIRAGTIGSLGVFANGESLGETGHTAPDPLQLHGSLAALRDHGCRVVVMEVTSHALTQGRVHGLSFGLGVFTNLVPLEHQEYHGTFADYVEAKSRFFDHLRADATLVYNADNLAVAALVEEREITGVGVGTSNGADIRITAVMTSAEGTRFNLVLPRRITQLGGVEVGPLELELQVALLGRSNVMNTALAVVVCLLLGVEPRTVAAAVRRIPPPRRRVELIHRGEFQILDDTVGHPESISALSGVVEALTPRRVHIAFAVRGMRGDEINRQTAAALATLETSAEIATLVVTPSVDAADERNVVSEDEMEAFRSGLRDAGVEFSEMERLKDAVDSVLDRAREGDLVLLLGAQGMDRGAAIASEWLAAKGLVPAS